MDARVPAVVAVVVTRDPGPWLEESLASLAGQQYEELDVLVLVAGGEADPSARVGGVLPDAFVRRLPDPASFGGAANEVIGMVQGAAYYLFCADDCALAPDAVRVMVQEAFRSNAAIVTPKVVRWDDPRVLVHVGMTADKTGAVVDRMQPGEVDHGQHDAVRDVFVAPTGCTLVRADLFAELGGFDPGIEAMGEDLDLSWRAQVAGARIVVAPDARVRSLQVAASGFAHAAPAATAGVSPQGLQRRHELRTMLKSYGWFHLLRVLPQAALLAVAEILAALAAGDRPRARVVFGAWRWNLSRAGEIRAGRRALRAQRAVSDAAVRRHQLRGSARLSTYFSRLAHQGFDVAHGRLPSIADGATADGGAADGAAAIAVLTGSVGGAFSEDADFDELDDLGRRAGRDRFGRRPRRRVLGSARSRLVAGLVVAVVVVFGTRDLFGGAFPLVGQLVSLGSWTGAWHHLVSGWQPAGLGTSAPATPAFAVLGAVGTLLLGGMGLTQKVLVLGCIPLGAWGVARLLRPFGSPRARFVAAVCYLGLPLPYDDLARGRWDGLVAYAAVPFVLARLARASGRPPFGAAPTTGDRPRRRDGLVGQCLALGVIGAVAMSFAPAMVVVLLLCGAALAMGSALVGDRSGTLRILGVAVGGTATALVLCGPWVVGVLAGGNAVSVLGLPSTSSSAEGWSQLLRFALGPLGGSPLAWFLLAASLLPLCIGRRARLAWAARCWAVAGAAWLLAWVVGRGWTGSSAPSIVVLLAPAAVALAASIGLGVVSFERDLSGYRFGWRQAAAALAAVAVVGGVIPVVAESFDGRWGLPGVGYEQSLGFVSPTGASGSYRVLWLGQPPAMPLGGWTVEPGLAYATSEDGTPSVASLWAPAGPGPAARLAAAVEQAMTGRTTRLGSLLVPASVRYVVVLGALAPSIVGVQTATALPPLVTLLPALENQTDLREIPGGEGFTVFENTDALPQRAAQASGQLPEAAVSVSGGLAGSRPVLAGPPGALSYQGALPRGAVFASYAPAGRWRLSVDGSVMAEEPAFGWAAQYEVATPGQGRLWFAATPWLPLALVAELVVWLVAMIAIVGRRRGERRRPRRLGRVRVLRRRLVGTDAS